MIMKRSYIFYILLIALYCSACGSETKVEVQDVHLENVQQAEETLEPPPPPPPPGASSVRSWLEFTCKTEAPGPEITAYQFALVSHNDDHVLTLFGTKGGVAPEKQTPPDYIVTNSYFLGNDQELKESNPDELVVKIRDEIADILRSKALGPCFLVKATSITISVGDKKAHVIR